MGRKTKMLKEKMLNEDTSPYGIYNCLETKTIQFPYGQVDFKSGETLLMPHNIPIEKRKIKKLYDVFKPYPNENVDLNNKKILITRYGGVGDILCILPAIYELKRKFPSCIVGFMGSPSYIPVLTNFKDCVNGLSNVISTFDKIKMFDYILCLDNTIERDLGYLPIHDLFAEYLNVKLTKSTMNDILLKNIKLPNINIRESNRHGIGIQYTSNAPLRNYNIEKIIEIINQLLNKYPNEEIHMLGTPDDFLTINYIQSKTNGRIIANGCGMQKMNLSETFDLVSTLKVVVAPDSSMIHFSGFNNTPCVGLYGPFPSDLRCSIYNHMIAIDAKSNCSPCMRHNPLSWCPYNSGEAECLNSIEPQMVVDCVDKLMNLYK